MKYPKVIEYMIPGYTQEYWGTWELEGDGNDSFPNLVYRRSDGFTHAEPKSDIWNRIASGIILVIE
jgi:hypothetical protein